MKFVFSFLTIFIAINLNAQDQEFSTKTIAVNSLIEGTLILPNSSTPTPLVIIIADTGPTDRNGNQNFQKHNALKKLAEGLANHQIASFRYDKRIVKQIRRRNIDPNLNFDHFVEDAESVIDYFKTNNTFNDIYIIGHGQGSLVGMLASNSDVAGFISLAGSGKPIDEVIVDQVTLMDPALVKSTNSAFAELKNGKLTRNYPQALSAIFNIETQPFMMSWMAYNPQKAIQELAIPILILSGTKDLQVPISEAELLKANAKNAMYHIIENMNHVLFDIAGNELENSKSYNESFRPISEELLTRVVEFIAN